MDLFRLPGAPAEDPVRKTGTEILVLDLDTGELANRLRDTPSLDVPFDFPRRGSVFTVADGFRASYLVLGGKRVSRGVKPRPLGWRKKGETCLVARTGVARRSRQYRICQISSEEAPRPALMPPAHLQG